MLEYNKVRFCEALMKLYAPKYYEKFECLADKCKHSCCVGWEIDIDQSTLEKYNSLSLPYAKVIKNSIKFDDYPHFKLKNNNCPHLNENGLCNIIINCGEEYICDICRHHPRFYNFVNQGKELGIGMSCEAACDLILNSDDYDQIIEVDIVDGDVQKYDYDSTKDRNEVFKLLKDNSLNIVQKIDILNNKFELNLLDFEFADLISKLEYLHSENKILFSKADKLFWNISISDELTRILAYYMYRYCSEAYDFTDFCISLSFAIICTGLISTLANKSNINNIARIVSEEIEYSEENMELIKSII